MNNRLFGPFLIAMAFFLWINTIFCCSDKDLKTPSFGQTRTIELSITKEPVIITCYSATIEQCDSSPLYTADGSFIDSNSINWVALSPDLIEIYPFGSIIHIICVDPDYSGLYVVHDATNQSLVGVVDILLQPGSTLSGGLWKGYIIEFK